MDTYSEIEFKNLNVAGTVSVERVDRAPFPCTRVLIMGPTGAGKSSFIEVLGLKDASKISSNGLDSCTQTICTYKLNNVVWPGGTVYLVDSPGFADAKMSEMKIISMLQKWMKDNNLFDHILYLTPISSIRLPGSQRRVLKTFHALTGVKSAENITIVTTMWDNVWGESATKRAEANYQQLEKEIWKDFIDEGAEMMRFHNTKASALLVIDQAFSKAGGHSFSLEDYRSNIKGSPFECNLLTDLQDRIQNLQSHIHILHSDIFNTEAQGDQLLLDTVHPMLKEAELELARFKRELDDFNALAKPGKDEDKGVSETKNRLHGGEADIDMALAQDVGVEPKQSDGEEPDDADRLSINASHIQLSIMPTSLVSPCAPLRVTDKAVDSFNSQFEEHASLPDNPAALTSTATDSRQPLHHRQHVPDTRPSGQINRVLKKLKCWGDSASERHEN